MTRLTRALQDQIVAAIRAGGFPHVAAQAFGVSRRTFEHWRKLGRSNEGEADFVSFARAVDEAIAQARLRAEIDMFTAQPRIWLQHGPGRETSESVGWTVAVKPAAKNRAQGNPLMNAGFMAKIQELREILESHPEAQAHVARWFEDWVKH